MSPHGGRQNHESVMAMLKNGQKCRVRLANKRRICYWTMHESPQVHGVLLRPDGGVEHAIEVTVDSLYEAVAQGLRVFRENDWIDEVGHGQTTISVAVRQPEVLHKVRVQDFERWLESQGRTPAEMSLKARLRELLSEVTRVASKTARNRT